MRSFLMCAAAIVAAVVGGFAAGYRWRGILEAEKWHELYEADPYVDWDDPDAMPENIDTGDVGGEPARYTK